VTGQAFPRVLNLSRRIAMARLWAATENGLNRITNGRVATLTTANGLPCNTVHWIIEDDRSSYWLYTRWRTPACSALPSWTPGPPTLIGRSAWRHSTLQMEFGLFGLLRGFQGPLSRRASDGKIWFLNGDTVSFIDPSHIDINTLPPPVHIEQITANRKLYAPTPGLRLPPLVHETHD